MPQVSIGLPVYNGALYIRDAIESFLGQTFPDFELIISDNASTDQTEQICLQFAAQDSRVRYYRNERNLGAAANYNRVFALSTGQYFKWAAHDDVCAPEYLETCVRALNEDPDAVLCYPKASIIDEQGRTVCEYGADNGFNLLSSKPSERLRQYFLAGTWNFHPVFGLMRRATLAATPLIGDYNGSDFVLLGHLAMAGRCVALPERLFFRREHGQRCCKTPIDQMALWWNPDNQTRFQFRHWRRSFEYFRAIRKPHLTFAEQLRCFVHVLKWCHWHRRLLFQDLTWAACKAWGLFASPHNSRTEPTA